MRGVQLLDANSRLRQTTSSSPSPLSDNVVQRVDGLVLNQPLRRVVLVLMHCLPHLLHEGLEVAELVEEGFVGEKLDVLQIVVGSVGGAAFVHLLQVLWLVGINSFEDA